MRRIVPAVLVALLGLVLAVARPAPAAVFPDMLGRSVSVPDRPLRLVSLAPSLTETAFAVGRGDWVVGVSEACDYPPGARFRASVGSMASPNLERIVNLRPDLILTSAEANTRETFAQLDRLRLAVFAIKPERYEDILTAIRLVGAALRADTTPLVQDIRSRIVAVRARVGARPRPRVLYLIWADPPIAAGPAAFIHDLIELAGGANVVGEPSARYLPLGWEEIVARRPEVILVAAHQGATNGGGAPAGPRAVWGWWESLPAVRSGRVLSLPADTILRPGPRVAEGVAILARAIHPDVFSAGGAP
jgi:iron complex transport system substrate-binding protein